MNIENVLTVTELNEYVVRVLEAQPPLNDIYVRGEISNYKLHSSGHHYMTLKDENAAVNAVMFRFAAAKLKFALSSGMRIIARGRVSLFPKTGQYQLYIDSIIPDGIGELYLAFCQLRDKIQNEGLFSEEFKKPLPKFPRRIALVTSPTGAAVRDMIRIIRARCGMPEIIVCPVLVQGAGAARSISKMLDYVNCHKLADVIIVGRGGGSIEDLWAFNEEIVARAIARSEIPVISAVGHEPDVTISDFVADARAATPSNAAEMVVPDTENDILPQLTAYENEMKELTGNRIAVLRHRLAELKAKPQIASNTAYIQLKQMTLAHLEDRLFNVGNLILGKYRRNFAGIAGRLDALSPFKVLARGYSIVTDINGRVISDEKDAPVNSEVNVKLKKGEIHCTVTKK